MTKIEKLITNFISKNKKLSYYDVSDILEDYEDVELAVEMYELPQFNDYSLQQITEEVEMFRKTRPDKEFYN